MAQTVSNPPTAATPNPNTIAPNPARAASSSSSSSGVAVGYGHLQSSIDVAWLRVNTTPIKQVHHDTICMLDHVYVGTSSSNTTFIVYPQTKTQSILAWCTRWSQVYTGHVKGTLVETLRGMETFMAQVKVRPVASLTYIEYILFEHTYFKKHAAGPGHRGLHHGRRQEH